MISVCSPNAYGQLAWEKQQISKQARPQDEQVEAVFAFVNEGQAPRTIRKIATSCDCTVTELDQKTYEPGEAGQIEASFSIGEHRGKRTSRIVVYLEGEDSPAATLKFTADVPQLFEMDQRFVFWTPDQPLEAKSILIQVHDEQAPPLVQVKTEEAGFELTLEPVFEPADAESAEKLKAYRLSIQPKATTRAAVGRLQLLAQLEPEQAPKPLPRLPAVHARVFPRDAEQARTATD